jgi:hypothetical protein
VQECCRLFVERQAAHACGRIGARRGCSQDAVPRQEPQLLQRVLTGVALLRARLSGDILRQGIRNGCIDKRDDAVPRVAGVLGLSLIMSQEIGLLRMTVWQSSNGPAPT